MMKIKSLWLFAIAVCVVAVPVAAVMHLRMTDSFPKKDQIISESPAEIRVWFSQDVSLGVSRLGLEGPGGDVEMSRVRETDDPKSFTADVGAVLGPGLYTVTWRTAGDDGHVQRGEYEFTMAAAHSP